MSEALIELLFENFNPADDVCGIIRHHQNNYSTVRKVTIKVAMKMTNKLLIKC